MQSQDYLAHILNVHREKQIAYLDAFLILMGLYRELDYHGTNYSYDATKSIYTLLYLFLIIPSPESIVVFHPT